MVEQFNLVICNLFIFFVTHFHLLPSIGQNAYISTVVSGTTATVYRPLKTTLTLTL